MSTSAPPTGVAFTNLLDLASETLGGRAVWSSDAFFASETNLVRACEPEWDADRYTDRGKWMDGWEPRRRRHPGHDTAIVQLGAKGAITAVNIDTRHFLGNHAPYASVDATTAPMDADAAHLRDHATWTPILDQVRLERGCPNVFTTRRFDGATHVRLHIYPAGGVARLRVFGQPAPAENTDQCDLLCADRGGRALACSDMFFSRMDNLIRPDEATDMGDGWETKRSPLPKQDWVILALSEPGRLDELLVHTRHFKGNYPTGVRIEGLYWPDAPPHALSKSTAWTPLCADAPLGPDRPHRLPVTATGPYTHLRMTILSDGGISRLRAYGRPEKRPPGPFLDWLNSAPEAEVRAALTRCCGARRWVDGMLAARPFASNTHLQGMAEHVWWHLGDGDWLEAFDHHPRIGANLDALREKFGSTATWSAGEQQSVASASDDVLQALAEGNRAYEARYGHIFIVCASGLSAAEMLARLTARMHTDPTHELRIAAGEQAKITALRIAKLQSAHPEPGSPS